MNANDGDPNEMNPTPDELDDLLEGTPGGGTGDARLGEALRGLQAAYHDPGDVERTHEFAARAARFTSERAPARREAGLFAVISAAFSTTTGKMALGSLATVAVISGAAAGDALPRRGQASVSDAGGRVGVDFPHPDDRVTATTEVTVPEGDDGATTASTVPDGDGDDDAGSSEQCEVETETRIDEDGRVRVKSEHECEPDGDDNSGPGSSSSGSGDDDADDETTTSTDPDDDEDDDSGSGSSGSGSDDDDADDDNSGSGSSNSGSGSNSGSSGSGSDDD